MKKITIKLTKAKERKKEKRRSNFRKSFRTTLTNEVIIIQKLEAPIFSFLYLNSIKSLIYGWKNGKMKIGNDKNIIVKLKILKPSRSHVS